MKNAFILCLLAFCSEVGYSHAQETLTKELIFGEVEEGFVGGDIYHVKNDEFLYSVHIHIKVSNTESGEERGGACSGTVIGSYHIITAAHCFNKSENERISSVMVGIGKKPTPYNGGVEVRNGYIHKLYSETRNPDYDVAVIRTLDPIVDTPRAIVITSDKLFSILEDMSTNLERSIVTGFGYFVNGNGVKIQDDVNSKFLSECGGEPFYKNLAGSFPNELKAAVVTLRDQNMLTHPHVTKSLSCQFPSTPCFGDSGGGLFADLSSSKTLEKQRILIGTVVGQTSSSFKAAKADGAIIWVQDPNRYRYCFTDASEAKYINLAFFTDFIIEAVERSGLNALEEVCFDNGSFECLK
mgnify:CR=1 FL=1